MGEFRNLDSKADNGGDAERNKLCATNPLVGPHFVLDTSFRSFLAIWLPLLSNLLCAVAFSWKKSKLRGLSNFESELAWELMIS